MVRDAVLTLVAVVAFGAPPLGAAEEAEASSAKWRLRLSSYGWLLGIDGTSTVDSPLGTLSISFDEFLDLSSAGLQLVATAAKGDWTISTDLALVDFGFEERADLLVVGVDLDQTVLTLKGGYRLLHRPGEADPASRGGLDLELGVRYWDVGSEVRLAFDLVPPGPLPPEFLIEADERWADLLLGTSYAARLSPRLEIDASADVGGFGLGSSSRFTWQATLMLTWKTGVHWALTGGYRALSWDRRTSATGVSTRNEIILHGPALGATLSF